MPNMTPIRMTTLNCCLGSRFSLSSVLSNTVDDDSLWVEILLYYTMFLRHLTCSTGVCGDSVTFCAACNVVKFVL